MNDATQFFNAVAGGPGYEIERSLRFNSADSAHLSRTPSVAGNQKTWTLSFWMKRTVSGNWGIFEGYNGSTTFTSIRFVDDKPELLTVVNGAYTGIGMRIGIAAQLRDFSAWYHFVISFDTTQSTFTDAVKFYINGVQQSTSLLNGAYVQNSDHYISRAIVHSWGKYNNGTWLDAYLADIHFIDGQALDPTSFGEFDTNGVWQPKAYEGSYGTNGFHLPFSDNSTAAALGTDTSGNGNDWTVNNFAVGGVLYSGYFDVLPVNSTFPFTSTYISGHVNTSTKAITNTLWVGAYRASGAVTWTPSVPIPVTSSIDVYGGSYHNASTPYTITVTYTDSSTSSISGSSSDTTWVEHLSASVPGKSVKSILVDATSFAQLCAVCIDGKFLVDGLPYANDSLVDSPTNYGTDTGAGGEVRGNYATWNPLDKGTPINLANGNLEASSTTGWDSVRAPIGIGSGKYYWEITSNTSLLSNHTLIVGIGNSSMPVISYIGSTADGKGYYALDGNKYPEMTAYGATYTLGDVIGVALDMDAGTLTFYKNGVSQGQSHSGLTGTWFPALSIYGTVSTTTNFGQRPFAFPAPSGFKALCTTNLEPPTIADGSTAMDVVTYTGNGSTQTISGLNFSPDLVWLKSRSNGYGSNLVDTVRGATNRLVSNATEAEATVANGLTAFTSDGFSLGSYTETNVNTGSMVAWTWDAGSSTVTNNDGSITSQVRANAGAGFSIVTYTGSGSAATVGHGLGVAPSLVIVKNRETATNWPVWHSSIPATNFLELNTTLVSTAATSIWNNTAPTSSVISVGTDTLVNQSTKNILAYCFAPVAGYSSFGSYTGNGLEDGPFVYTGFRPRWLMVKRTDTANSNTNWAIYDTTRADNPNKKYLLANTSAVEGNFYDVDMLSNGFKLRLVGDTINQTNGTYIYAAFAEHPFATARAR